MPRWCLPLLLLALASVVPLADADPAAVRAEDDKGPVLAGKDTPLKPLVTGLKNPESVCIGPDGRTYVTTIGEFDKDGGGAGMVIDKGEAKAFASGLDDPKGIVTYAGSLFVADKTKL